MATRLRHVLVTVVVAAAGLALATGMLAWALQLRDQQVSTSADGDLDVGAAAQLDGNGYRLWALRTDGSPVRWDPCTPIQWETRASDPDWLTVLATQAFESVGSLAGLTFEHVGDDATMIGPQRAVAHDDASAWQPVLVTMTTPTEVDWLRLDDRALAVPVAVDGVFVTGQVLLNDGEQLPADFSTRMNSWGATLLHEVGHLVGLDHVDDPDQLMYPRPMPGESTWSDGDLAGLATLAAEDSCLPTEVRQVHVVPPGRR